MAVTEARCAMRNRSDWVDVRTRRAQSLDAVIELEPGAAYATARRSSRRAVPAVTTPWSSHEHLVESDARGVHSHGLLRVPQYVGEMECGEIDGQATPTVYQPPPRVASSIDGRRAFGQVSAERAVEEAAAAAEAHGIGLVADVPQRSCRAHRRVHRGRSSAARLPRARVLQRAAERTSRCSFRRRRRAAGRPIRSRSRSPRTMAGRRRLLDQHASPREPFGDSATSAEARADRSAPGRRGPADERPATCSTRAARAPSFLSAASFWPQGLRARRCWSRR